MKDRSGGCYNRQSVRLGWRRVLKVFLVIAMKLLRARLTMTSVKDDNKTVLEKLNLSNVENCALRFL